jgi:hypothetical protein
VVVHIKELINNIIDNISVFNDIIFEDCAVGVAMNKYGVYPKDLDVKSNGCMWGSPTKNTKSSNATTSNDMFLWYDKKKS